MLFNPAKFVLVFRTDGLERLRVHKRGERALGFFLPTRGLRSRSCSPLVYHATRSAPLIYLSNGPSLCNRKKLARLITQYRDIFSNI